MVNVEPKKLNSSLSSEISTYGHSLTNPYERLAQNALII